jgi:GT2 family glycosyltransferase
MPNSPSPSDPENWILLPGKPAYVDVKWIVMPVLAGPEMTERAIADCLAQTYPTRILVINQAVESSFRERLERLAEAYSDQIFIWSHEPTLPSLAASWNRALDFVWSTGATEALVVNNDIRLHPRTYEGLLDCLNVSNNLFVTAVGVTEAQFDVDAKHPLYWYDEAKREVVSKGGPDFSCFLIAKECHQKYRFDENFIPAYCEDLDYHRRLMLSGQGHRIFSVNLPYLHYAAGTLKQIDPARKAAIERAIGEKSRTYYEEKWGGPVNHETFYGAFNDPGNYPPIFLSMTPSCGPTTPELQAWTQTQHRVGHE